MADDALLTAKAIVGSIAIASASTFPGFNSVSVPFIGVPLTALTMAAAGAVCSFAWSTGTNSRARLFVVATASTFVGAACVSVIPHLFGKTWPAELHGPLAFVFGLLAQWVVPATRGAIPTFFKGLAVMLVRMVGGKIDSAGGDRYNNYGGEGYDGEESDGYEPKVYKPRTRREPPTDGEA